ncbi:MAG: PorV/PorQ family protein [Bacteroidetes bacterium]|nr:PorV/PorQ family protein [Bacteroidota bacterium]
MKRNIFKTKKSILTLASVAALSVATYAGNPDRIGQAGATQLLINPWAQTSGMGWASVSSVRGLEATFVNIGGLAHAHKTELGFSNTNWLVGSGISINSFGFAQSLGGEGVLSLSVMTTNLGDIDITTVEQPEGGLGTVSPRLNNIGIGFAKKFTTSISGGVLVRIHSESIPNAKSSGIAIDGGIQYTETSNKKDKLKKNDIKFGISMKNVGPDSKYGGDGLTFKANNPNNDVQQSYLWRTASYGLPTLINIGGSYDFRLDKTKETYNNRLTTALNFTSNAYSRNQFTFGLEYGYKKIFMLRGGYAYEKGITNSSERTTAYNGLTGGFSIELPMGKTSDNIFAVDYSYRHSNPFSGTHAVGVRILID